MEDIYIELQGNRVNDSMRVLVTGSGGQVGRLLVRQLEKTDWELMACDRAGLDITSKLDVFNVIEEFKPDVIINAAAYTAVDMAEKDKRNAYKVNGDGPKYLAQAASISGSVLFHISTDYVFSGDKKGLYIESDEANPKGVYGLSKLSGEQAVHEFCHKSIVLRTSWVFGEVGGNFVKTMLRLAQDRDELRIVSDQYGGPTYAGDIANTLLLMIQHLESNGDLEWGTFHYSGHPYVSWYEFAQEIFKSAVRHKCLSVPPKLTPIRTEEYPTAAKRPSNSILDCGKIKNQMDILPSDWLRELNNVSNYCNGEE